MKKLLFLLACTTLLAVCATSCSKGCTCTIKTDITGAAPIFEDENMNADDCAAMEVKLNDEAGMEMYKCK